MYWKKMPWFTQIYAASAVALLLAFGFSNHRGRLLFGSSDQKKAHTGYQGQSLRHK